MSEPGEGAARTSSLPSRLPAALRAQAPAIAALLLAACAYGAFALVRLPSALYPEVSFPRIIVAVTLPGASAATLQRAAVRPVEEALLATPGVRKVRSRTIRSAAEVSVWFDPDADMDRAAQLVNARLAEARADLPRDTDLTAERLTPSAFPILSLAVTGAAPPAALREVALTQLRPRLAGLPGVGRVTVVGGDAREIEVEVDPARLEAAGLGLEEVAAAVSDALPNEAAGRVDAHYQQRLVVVSGPLNDLDQLGRVVVGGTAESPVRLSDIATLSEGHADRTSLTSANGRPAALVNVGRQPGADAIALARAVERELEAARATLPPGVEVVVTYDQAALIGKAVANVRDAVLLGGALTVLVVGLFLRSWRGTLVAAAALPSTLLMTFAAMRLAGGSMNLMSLGGLAVAIGLVVDDAVVVVEAVHRRVTAGLEPWAATAQALGEIAWPVTSSTLTTVVVFAPLSLLSGVAGQFFSALAFTLCAAVLLSLAVALLVTPLACGRLLRPERAGEGRLRAWLGRAYGGALARALARPGAALGAAAAVALGLGLWDRGVPTDFLPELDEGAFVVDYFAPVGTSLAEADRLGALVERTVAQEPEVAITSRRLGAELGPPAATEPSSGDITVTLRERRDRDGEEVVASARDKVAAAAPGVRVEFIEVLQDMLSDLEGAPEPVEVKLLGPDVDALRAFAPRVAAALGGVDGLADLYDGVARCAPEDQVRVDPDAAGRLGLSPKQVSEQVRTALLGEVVAQVPRRDRLLNVRVRLRDPDRLSADALQRLRVRPPRGAPVPLASVAAVEAACVPSELLSENLRPLVTVTARLERRDLGSATSEVEEKLAGLTPPAGVQVALGGQREGQLQSFQALAAVLALAAGAVLALLAFHFRGLRLPLAVMGLVPVAIAAGVAALRAAGVPLNVSSLMGCILLVGLVVKNGILLLDAAESRRRAGTAPEEAIRAAAGVRLRPILMTTLATLLGLLPLALGLGTGAELQRPLAVAVIGGLALSTVAVLVALPPAYVLLVRRRR